ncbi:glycerol-3-phosphate dehydrogenase C-terminal domain-containing protein, partial [Nonomuraea lactucae]|uniref:glycerol-3-phosphate dehydrogenase C-terminal domain-containing protein n=1 Tax=Nonomuraea lactucae TaxID=2249762 RepID=UPI0023DD5B8F
PCRTARLPLVGAPGSGPGRGGSGRDEDGGRRNGRAGTGFEEVPARLVERYGNEAPAVAELVRRHPEEAGLGITKGELLWSVRHEGALDEGDLLDRRTRIGLVPEDRQAALPVARDTLG